MIDRRSLIGAFAGSPLALPFAADAQPGKKIWRVGYIGIAPPGTSPVSEQLFGVFVQTLGESGFVEGKNIAFERRAAEGRADRARAVAAELVGLHVDLIVVILLDSALAAKSTTTAIPIVMMGVSDPVGAGLAVSLSRPGGNVTGLTDIGNELDAKRLELLKAAAPRALRVALLEDDYVKKYGDAMADPRRRAQDAAAKALGMRLIRVVLNTPQDFEGASAAVVSGRVDAVVVSANSGYSVRKELAEFAIQRRLPSMVASRPVLSGGALMSYGADYADIYRKGAVYVAKILKGAKPADLPIEQPTKVELIINLKTAKAIGLTIPRSMLLRADEVIE